MSLLAAEPGFIVSSGALEGEPEPELTLLDTGPRSTSSDPVSLERTPTLALVRDDDAALAVLRAGAMGVLLRNVDGARLVAGLRAVASGLSVFDPALLRGVLGARAAPSEAYALTPREAEVLSLLAEGLSNKSIAERLKISEHTAKFHVNAILNKLGAETRTEAVVLAARSGLLML